jgi:hypothetical protein
MKRLFTEGVTGEMRNHCTTRVYLMALIKQADYMLSLVFGSRGFSLLND